MSGLYHQQQLGQAWGRGDSSKSQHTTAVAVVLSLCWHGPTGVLRRWWAQWCAYTRYKQPPASEAAADGSSEAHGSASTATITGPEMPDSIDNQEIVYGERLKDNLEEGKDFVIVSTSLLLQLRVLQPLCSDAHEQGHVHAHVHAHSTGRGALHAAAAPGVVNVG